MKSKIILLAMASLLCGRIPGLSTANAKTATAPAASDTPPATPTAAPDLAAELAALKDRLDQQEKDNAELRKQLAAATAAPAEPEDTGLLALLCKGAGVSLDDVRWRVKAGLDPDQAVQVALAQKASEDRKEKVSGK